MKKRTFFTTLFLFLLFFNSAIFLISIFTWKDKLNAQKELSLSEHYMIISSLWKDIQALDSRNVEIEQNIQDLMRPYLFFRQNNNRKLIIFQKERQIYADTFLDIKPPFLPEILPYQEETRNIFLKNQMYHGKETPFLFIIGSLPEPWQDYTLLYCFDLTNILSAWKQMKNMLFLFGGLISLLLAVCLLLLLNRLFRPLMQISTASKNMALGDLSSRLSVSGHDELADMAKSFNHMADEIENQIMALQEAAEQKQRFVDNFAHELRTPLTAIYGYAEYLQKAVITEEDKITSTGYIMTECQRLQNIAWQLLDLAMLRTENIKYKEILVSEFFQNIHHLINKKAMEHQVSIRYENKIDYLYGNQDLLESLLVNLIDNAQKACNKNGKILVSVYKKEDNIILSVADNGRGMSPEQLLHVKEAFYRVDKARSRQDGGAGLGLFICEQIVKLHHASLQISSQSEKGTIVKIIFTTFS